MAFTTSLRKCLLLLPTLISFTLANFPLLDVDTNMRIVLVPYDTPVGSIIYRLRASDSDNNFPLAFEVLGTVGKGLLTLEHLGCVEAESMCQADVVLRKALDVGRTYEFQLQVKDTMGDYTRVHAALTATGGSYHFNPLFAQRILHLAEDCHEGTLLERFEVLKHELNSRIVHLEIRDKTDQIGLKQRLVSNNKTEGTLFLRKKLDYENQPWFTFQLLAMNAWTNASVDTRNILVADVIVAVHDVQDSPPIFTMLPSELELNSSIKIGDKLAKVEATDGDKQNKRLIRYGFLADSNPFIVFFDLDPMTGVISLRRNITELLAIAKPQEPIKMTVIAEEIVSESGHFGRSFTPALERTLGNVTFWFGKKSSFGPPTFSSNLYIGEIQENRLPGALVHFEGSIPLSIFHPNPNEPISLSLTTTSSQQQFIGPPPFSPTFQLLPSHGYGNFSFEIRLGSSSTLDYESIQELRYSLLALSTASSLSSESQLIIHIRDENDNAPVFTQSEYRVELPEHSPRGSKVVQVKATDRDTGGAGGRVMYSNLAGSDAFHLDEESGEITVDKPELLDRELEPEIRLYVEAKDGGYSEGAAGGLVRNMASASIIVKLLDKNDNAPTFLQKYYQAVLVPQGTSFTAPLHVKAVDGDEGGNGMVRYQSMDSRFFVDPTTGEVRVRGAPITRNPAPGDGPYLGSFRIRAYDLGNPQQSSETVVQLFSEEMVTREIQFVFPSSPEKIWKNQTNIEKMLSSLTGGIVGIKKITSLSQSARSGLVDGGDGTTGDADGPAEGRSFPPEPPPPVSQDFPKTNKIFNSAETRGRSESLSSSEKSLVTATVQYPVSATPTRVDLAAFQREYGNAAPDTGTGGGGGGNPTKNDPDADMIKLYEAENRALFWILITFLLLLFILFSIFLCCIYCPCCWLYGHCYSKGDVKGSALVTRERVVEHVATTNPHKGRHGRKTYPEDDTEESGEPEGGTYRRGLHEPAHGHLPPKRREAWSGEDSKRGWKGPEKRYRERPLTPPTGHGHGRPPMEADVSLEDWDYEPHRMQDRADEIGPRWQNMQHPSQTITVPIPMSMIPINVQQQLQHQPQIAQGPPHPHQRRVGYVGAAHPGDEDYMRGGAHPPPPLQETFNYERAQSTLPRHYPGIPSSAAAAVVAAAAAAPTASAQDARATRFFKTESGEVLQFADIEAEDGKEMLIQRYVDEQHRSREVSATATPHNAIPEDQLQVVQAAAPSIISLVDRPRAAVSTKRPPQPQVKEELAEVVIRDEDVGIKHTKKKSTAAPPPPAVPTPAPHKPKDKSKSKHKNKPPHQQDEDEDQGVEAVAVASEEKDIQEVHQDQRKKSKKEAAAVASVRRSLSRSLSDESGEGKREKSKSKSKSRSNSPKIREKSKSTSPEKKEKTRSKVKRKHKEREQVEIGEKIEKRKHLHKTVKITPSAADKNVDIHVIPPSSAAMTDENDNDKEEVKGDGDGIVGGESLKSVVDNVENSHDDDSGIGVGVAKGGKRNKMLEKKSVFTIAYDDIAQKTLMRPDTAGNNSNEEEVKVG